MIKTFTIHAEPLLIMFATPLGTSFTGIVSHGFGREITLKPLFLSESSYRNKHCKATHLVWQMHLIGVFA